MNTEVIAQLAYSATQIHQRVAELADELTSDLSGKRPLLISVLRGSVIFLADLVRDMGIEPEVEFMSISSYGPETEAGVVRIVKDIDIPIEGRHAVVVEDIVDTGFTLSYLLRTLQTRNPATLRVCTLVDKTVRRILDLNVDYSGFTSDDFLIGYGLDFQGRYRNLPYLAAVRNVGALVAQPDALLGLFQAGGTRADI